MSKIDLILEYIIAKESAESAKNKYNYEYAEYYKRDHYPHNTAHLKVIQDDYIKRLERLNEVLAKMRGILL